MSFPLSGSDISLWLAVMAVILIVTSESLNSMPSLASRIPLDKNILRTAALGCGLAFFVTVIMRVLGYI